MPLTRGQWWKLGFVAAATIAYLGLTVFSPRGESRNSYDLPIILILVLSLAIIGLLMLAWWLGFYAWLELDRYTKRLHREEGRLTFGRMATGVWFLVSGLVLSSLISATRPFYADNVGMVAMVTQINYYVIIIFPFLGFMWLRIGSRYLSVSAQAMMSLRSKLVTVGPPVLLLASFYVFLASTNSAPSAAASASGPVGFLALPVNIVLVVGSWVFGLLAALNIERATHGGGSAGLVRPLAKLYNGILLVTGGFIILDALMSLGTTRLQALPLGIVALLIYGFIGVVALGFLIMARGARELRATTPGKARTKVGD